MTFDPNDARGKPFVVFIDGEKHPAGTITRAALKGTTLMLAVQLEAPDQEEGWEQ